MASVATQDLSDITDRAAKMNVSMDFLTETIDRVHNIDQTTWDREQIASWYDEWSQKYEQDIALLEQRGSTTAADYLQKLYGKTPNVQIMDVACGAGALGMELAGRGFSNIHGVDASSGMVKQATDVGVYSKLVCSFVEQVFEHDVPKESYDVVVCVGAIAPNHLPPSAIDPMCRLLKPGGVMVLIGCNECWNNLREYHIEMRAEFDRLLEDGQLESVLDEVMDKYLKTEKWVKGVFLVFRKLAKKDI